MKKLLLALCSVLLFSSTGWGAEFLVIAKRHWSYKASMSVEEQAEYDKQYQVGDIVQVFPDGKLSDNATAGGKFYVVRVSGLAYDTALKYHEQWIERNGEETIFIKRRKFRIRATELPASVKNQLQTTGVYNTTWTAVKSYIRNNVTGLDE